MTPADRQAALAVAERETPESFEPLAEVANDDDDGEPRYLAVTDHQVIDWANTSGDEPEQLNFVRRDVMIAFGEACHTMGVEQGLVASDVVLRRCNDLVGQVAASEARATAAEARVAKLREALERVDEAGMLLVATQTAAEALDADDAAGGGR